MQPIKALSLQQYCPSDVKHKAAPPEVGEYTVQNGSLGVKGLHLIPEKKICLFTTICLSRKARRTWT